MATNNSVEVEKVLSELFKKTPDHITPGIERAKKAWQILGADLSAAILIGGTNGKGTTAGLLFELLKKAGFKVGLYTSPHILHFHERIQLSHRPTSDEEIVLEVERIRRLLPLELWEQLSFFEITTLAAFTIFAKEQTDYQVIEVGLGGRLDATNILDPLVSCITSIDLDHTQWLGSSYEEIAREKLGIARRDKPLFWLEPLESTKAKGLEVLLEQSAAFEIYQKDKQMFCDEKKFYLLDKDKKNTLFSLSYSEAIKTKDPAFKQNALGALSLLWFLMKKKFSCQQFEQIATDVLNQKIYQAPSLLGRGTLIEFSYKEEKLHLFLDVAHNPAGVKNLICKLQLLNLHPSASLCGFMKDKDYQQMVDLMSPYCKNLFLFKLPTNRSFDPSLIKSHSNLIFFSDVYEFFEKILSLGIKSSPSEPILIFGSFVLIEQFFRKKA